VGILVRDVSHYKRRTDKPAAKWHSSVLPWLRSHRIKHWNVLFIFTQWYEVITPLNDTVKYCLLHVKPLCLLHQVFIFLFYCHTSTFSPLRNEKLRTLNCPSKSVRVSKSSRMKWAGYVARVVENRNAYRVLTGKPEGNRGKTKVKGKAIPLQAWTGPEGSRRLRLPDFKTIDTWRWQGCQPYAPAAFTPRKYFWYSFLLGAKSTPGP